MFRPSTHDQGPNESSSFAKRTSASVSSEGGNMSCSNVHQTCPLFPDHPMCLPALPTAVDRRERSTRLRASQIFSDASSFMLTYSFTSAQPEKFIFKCRHCQPLVCSLQPLRGHRFIGTRVPVSFETSPTCYSNLDCFASSARAAQD